MLSHYMEVPSLTSMSRTEKENQGTECTNRHTTATGGSGSF